VHTATLRSNINRKGQAERNGKEGSEEEEKNKREVGERGMK
jgi:hypothetical protein